MWGLNFKPLQPLAGAVRIEPKPQEADLSEFEVTIDLLRCLPGTLAQQYNALPVGLQAGTLWVAVPKDTPPQKMAELQSALHRRVRFFLVAREPLRVLLTRYYGANKE